MPSWRLPAPKPFINWTNTNDRNNNIEFKQNGAIRQHNVATYNMNKVTTEELSSNVKVVKRILEPKSLAR